MPTPVYPENGADTTVNVKSNPVTAIKVTNTCRNSNQKFLPESGSKKFKVHTTPQKVSKLWIKKPNFTENSRDTVAIVMNNVMKFQTN